MSIFLVCALSSNEESQVYCREHLVFFAPFYLVFLLVVGALLGVFWIIVADDPLVDSTQKTLHPLQSAAFIIPLLSSALGGVALFFFPFIEWKEGYVGESSPVKSYFVAAIFAPIHNFLLLQLILGFFAVGLFYCADVSYSGYRSPEKITRNKLIKGYQVAATTAIGIGLAALLMVLVFIELKDSQLVTGRGVSSWRFGLGAYAAILCSIFAAALLYRLKALHFKRLKR